MKSINRFLKAVDSLSNMLRWPSYFCLITLIGVMSYEIALRYIFLKPTAFTFDIAIASAALMVAFSVSWVLREEGHISITLLTERFSLRTQYWIIIVTSFIGAFIMAFMTFQMVLVSVQSGKVKELTETLGMPLAPLKYVLTMGFGLLTFQFFVRIQKYFRMIREMEK